MSARRDRRKERRMQVNIRMTEDQEAAFRVEHGLEHSDSTRERLATMLADELGGLGAEYGWWDADAVHVT
ncbi:hypothetical protein [Nocardiopsis suaedae]|uniref:Uncharacterized protein n=1 Tax=Nocardiopsis suaedae TaxID=3018444 RepID=A0ABT4TLW9_9ACTN|nr:hypothetical protein [Nocardiopsis suaedae]MDA2805688.1 hypothetical protein [Nocardiopsis suaedae]